MITIQKVSNTTYLLINTDTKEYLFRASLKEVAEDYCSYKGNFHTIHDTTLHQHQLDAPYITKNAEVDLPEYFI